MKFVSSLILIATFIVTPCYAEPCGRAIIRNDYVSYNYIAPTIIIPQYTISYTNQQTTNDIALLREEIRALRDELRPRNQNHPGLVTLNNKCSSCHEQKVSKSKGGDFTLLLGDKLSPTLTGEDLLACLTNINDQSMPKKGEKLNPQEVAAVSSLFKALRTKDSK